MKQIKEFDSMKELNAVIKALEKNGVVYEVNGAALLVHTGDIIRVRDIILDTVKEVRNGI